MEDQIDEHVDKSETFEDIYNLAVKINDADLKKLRQDLQQIRFEIAETQAKVNSLRSTPSSDSLELTQAMRAVSELRKTQSTIVSQINSSIINQAGTVDRMASALSTLNAEMTSGNFSSQNLAAYVSLIEGAVARMSSVSKKSEDFKKLQSSLSDIGVDVNVQSIRGASRDVNKLREDVEAIDNTPVRITIDGQHTIQTVASQIQWITHLSKQLSAELNRNVMLLTEMNNVSKSIIITPSAYTGRIGIEGKPLQRMGSIYDIAAAQALPSQQARGIPPNEVVRAAYFGAPIFWRDANQQVMTTRNTMEPRGTSTADVRNRIASMGLSKQAPALHQFGAFENSTFLNVSDATLIANSFQEFLKPIDPTILSGLKTLESRYNKGNQIRNRSQIGQIIRNISADKLASSMDKAYYFQLAKMVALYQQDLEDTGSSHYYMRGRPSLDINDRQLYMLNLINQFGGTLQTSEISRALGTGHYQGVAADVRTLLSKGLISRAIVPPFPIESANIPNAIAPQIMAANLLAPNVGLDAAMATTMIKPLSTTDLGKRVLAMVGMTGAPSNVDADVFLNKFVDKVENVLVEKQPIRFGVQTPKDPRLWFSGIETKVYGENKLGDRIVYFMEEFINNIHAIKPEYVKNLLPFIPFTEEAGRRRVDVDALRSGAYNLTDISTAKYLNARSDIYTMLQTPLMSIDKIMQVWASPRRDVFTEDMAGSDLYRKSVLWWASGPAGIGVNPQLSRYTTNPDQAIQHLNTLYSGYATDKFLAANPDAFKSLTGSEYQGFSHYERSIIVRAMQEMLTRAVPVTSGFDVAANESFRARPSMTKAEARTARDMLMRVRQEELENLVTNVPDLGRIITAIEKHNDDIMASSTVAIADVVRPKVTSAYQLTPDQMANVFRRTDIPTVWKKHAEFFGATPGQTYEDTYSLDRAQSFRNIMPDANVLPMSVAAVGGMSYAKQLGTSRIPSDITKFKRQSELSPVIGFSGRLPWNEILKYRVSMGSTELRTPEAQAEFERLLANPQELMKELYWDEDELIKETYGTMAVKTPLFYRTMDIPQSAIKDLQKRTADFRPEDAFAEAERKRKQYERFKGTVYERPTFRAMKEAQDKLRNLESVYNAEVSDWASQWNIEQDVQESIINPYKMTKRGTVANFYTYMPASVDKQKVIERMDYERQKGLMDPGLIEQYARSIANFRTNKNTGRTFRQGIEAMFTGQDWSREAMSEMKGLGEQLLLHGFLRHGAEGTFDMFHRDTWDVEDFSVQTIIDAMGHDTSMMTDEDISRYLQEDPDFQSSVREAFMADQDLTKEQYNVLTESLSTEMRQLAKKFGHLPEFKVDIENYVSRVMESAAPSMIPEEGRYPIGENDIFVEKPEDMMSTLPGGYALIDVLKKVAWKEGSKKQLTTNEQKKAMHAALIEWRKKDEDNYYYSDYYDENWVNDPEGMLASIASQMPVLPAAMPMINLDSGTETGRYSFIKNAIGINPQAGGRGDFENIVRHELMHPLAYEKLLAPGGFGSMKDFYNNNRINMFQYSIGRGSEAIAAHKSAPLLNKLSRYLDQLSKSSTDEEFQNEMRRLNPANTFYRGASTEDIGLLSSYGEEISMVMAAYDDNVENHIRNLESRYGPGDYGEKVNFIRNFVGAPGNAAGMPSYVNPSFIGTTAFSTGIINALRAGGPSYRNTMRNMRGPNQLLPSAARMMIPESVGMPPVGQFASQYISPSSLPTGVYLGGGGGVMRSGTSQSGFYTADQLEAWRRRTFGRMAIPASTGGGSEPELSINPPPLNIPDLMYQMSWKGQALSKLNNSIFGKIFGNTKSFISKVTDKHQQNIVNMMERMPDVSLGDPSKIVSQRGMEVPISYVLKSEMFGGDMDAMRNEMKRFYISLEDQGVDTSKIKHDVIQQSGLTMNAAGKWERQNYGQIQIFGKARLGAESGKTESEFADMLRGNMTMGFASVNEQGAKFENTIPRINSHMERFASYGNKLGDMSWKFTTLQMAALGIFFSMMSIMSVMSTGISLVTGGLSDLDSMMKAKAMAGMSGQFTDKQGNVITGAAIDSKLGITDADRIAGWKTWTDMIATISTIMSGVGTKVVTNPKFIESAGVFINRLLDTVSRQDAAGNYVIVDKLVNLSETLFDTLGDIVEIAPTIIDVFDKIASFKTPEWIPILGGKSMLAIGATAALTSAMLMPILAGLTLFAKAGRGVGMITEAGIGVSRWNTGRQMEAKLLEMGYDPLVAKAARQGFGIPGRMGGLDASDIEWAKRTGLSGGLEASVADDIAKANVNFAKNIKDSMTLTSEGLSSSEKAGLRLSGIIDEIVERLRPIVEKIPGVVPKTAAQAGAATAARVLEKNAPEIPVSKIVSEGSKWAYVGSTVGSVGMSMIPYAAMTAFPESQPVMEPANTALAFTPLLQSIGGMGALGAASVAGPLGVIASAPAVGGGELVQVGDRYVSKEKYPKEGFIEGILGLTENKYLWSDTNEEVPGFTDYDWDRYKNKVANGITEEPLSSKWTKESGATFNQTNTFNTVMPVDDVTKILDYVERIARQIGI